MKAPASLVTLRERVVTLVTTARTTITAAQAVETPASGRPSTPWRQNLTEAHPRRLRLRPRRREVCKSHPGHPGVAAEGHRAGWLAPLLFDLGGDVQLVQHVDRIPTATAVNRLKGQRVVPASRRPRPGSSGGRSEDPAEQLDLARAGRSPRPSPSARRRSLPWGCTCPAAPAVTDLNALERRARERLLALGVWLSSTQVAARRRVPHGRVLFRRRRLGRRRTLDTTTLALAAYLAAPPWAPRAGRWRRSSPTAPPVFLDLYARAQGWNNPGLCIVSPPGGGKTVAATIGTWACRHLTLPDPPDVLLVDPKVAELPGASSGRWAGRSSGISPSPEVVINPVDLPPSRILSGTGEESEQNPVDEARLRHRPPRPDGGRADPEQEDRAHDPRGAGGGGGHPGRLRPQGHPPRRHRGDLGRLPRGRAHPLPDVLAHLGLKGEKGDPISQSLATRCAFCTGTLAGLFSGGPTLKVGATLG